MKQVVIIGVGLIGGSLAMDIKKLYPEAKFTGVDTNENHLVQALELGLIDRKGAYSDVEESDLVILSIPVDVSVTALPKILDQVGENTLVLDMGSTKQNICEAVKEHKNRRNFFVGLRA